MIKTRGESLWLVTSVLDPQQLSVRSVEDIYRRRWGVEVFIRGLKQTFGRGKLRSHATQNVPLGAPLSAVHRDGYPRRHHPHLAEKTPR